MLTNRRVVTGHNADGKSNILFDSTIDALPMAFPPVSLIWATDGLLANNETTGETCSTPPSVEFFNEHRAKFFLMEMNPGDVYDWHQTNTIDFGVVISGTLILTLEDGEVVLGPGDLMVDRGGRHKWGVVGDEPAVLAAVILPADPIPGVSDVQDTPEVGSATR